jgi:RNA polymerase sigma factor (sigma-70 family)
MKVDVRCDGFKMDRELEKAIEKKVNLLEKRLKRYHPDVAHLTIKLNKMEKKDIYNCDLELNVLQQFLTASKMGETPVGAFSQSFRALLKAFEKYRLKLNKNLKSKKDIHHLRAEAQALEEKDWHEFFKAIVTYKLKDLLRLARHEIVNMQIKGVLEPGELRPEEVVDEAVVRVFSRSTKKDLPKDIEWALTREIIAVVEEFAEKLASERSATVSLEESVAITPPEEEVSTLGEEILYFYQPDEALKLEDVVADPTALTPQDVVEDAEVTHILYNYLNELPDSQRKAYTLTVIEGYSPEEVAMIMQLKPEKVNQLVEQARESLQQKLTREKAALSKERVDEIFLSLKSIPVEYVAEERIHVIQSRIVFAKS